MLNPNPLNSCNNTLNDSGIPGCGMASPLTIASYVFALPITSSDLTVRISWRILAAPYASNAHTSISPKRWPPNWWAALNTTQNWHQKGAVHVSKLANLFWQFIQQCCRCRSDVPTGYSFNLCPYCGESLPGDHGAKMRFLKKKVPTLSLVWDMIRLSSCRESQRYCVTELQWR